jgi:GTPase SAR1 family protein
MIGHVQILLYLLLSLLAMASSSSDASTKNPVVIITIGMAGAGKSTFVQQINSYLHSKQRPPYILNLDPAVANTPFEPNIDIRDTINYAEVMKQCVTVSPRF